MCHPARARLKRAANNSLSNMYEKNLTYLLHYYQYVSIICAGTLRYNGSLKIKIQSYIIP